MATVFPLLQTPPSTRYNPLRPDKARAADFGAGGACERGGACAAALGSTTPQVGPGAYTPRHRAGPGRPQHVRIQGKPPTFSSHQPTPAPGDFEPSPRPVGPSHGFSRGKTGRMPAQRAKLSMGPAPGLVMWNALEPVLVRAGAGPRVEDAIAVAIAEQARAREASSVDDSGLPGRYKEEYFKNLAKSIGRDPPKW